MAVLLVFTLVGCSSNGADSSDDDNDTSEDIGDKGGNGGGGETGFTITGYTGGANYTVYACTSASFTNATDIIMNNISSGGNGDIKADGTVEWNKVPSNGSYTLYILETGSANVTKKTSSTVTITNGNGIVAYSAFVNM